MELAEIESLAFSLGQLKKVVVLTGSGISAESGIPTFRGAEGLWQTYRAEELATPQAFASNPKLVWEWYLFRRQLITQAQPNAAHVALADLERLLGDRFCLITQNVDGLHGRAGSQCILELHGNIFVNRCWKCARPAPDDVLNFNPLPPLCSHCGGTIRPGVVWFGESLNVTTVEDAFAQASSATLFLCIGTSAVVHPAAALPLAAHEQGAYLIEINPEPTPLSSEADLIIRHSAARVLPALVARIRHSLRFYC